MAILRIIMQKLNIREQYEIPEALMTALLDDIKRQELMEALKDVYSYGGILAEFEEQSADRKNYMQDYTPQCVLDIVARIAPGGNVRDVCAGIGGLSLTKYNTDKTIDLHLEEYSKNAIAFLLLNLLMAEASATVVEKNVLTGEKLNAYRVENGSIAQVPVPPLEDWKYDTVISNPPYSMPWDPVMDERFEGYKLAPKSKADYAFVLDGIHSLADNGTAVYILPHGALFRGQAEGDIRRELIDRNLLDAVVGLPGKLFVNTDIPVCVLVFKKNRDRKDILFIDAQKEFKKLKNKNQMTVEHVTRVINTYATRSEQDKYSRCVSIEEIRDNDYNLNIPRYIDNFEPEPIPDALEMAKALNQINEEAEQVGREVAVMLRQLVCTNPEDEKEFKAFIVEMEKFLTSSTGAVTVQEEEAVIAKLQDLKKYLLAEMFV